MNYNEIIFGCAEQLPWIPLSLVAINKDENDLQIIT